MNVALLYDWSDKIEAFLATWLGDGIVPAHCGAVHPVGSVSALGTFVTTTPPLTSATFHAVLAAPPDTTPLWEPGVGYILS